MSKIQSGSRKSKSQEARLSGVAITDDCLTSRAGLAPLGRYLDQTGILSALEGTFSDVRKNGKGASVRALFKQVLCFMADGTCRHMTHFEHLAKDPGYAASIETASQAMVSSHAVKRFFAAFDEPTSARFRPLLRRLGLSRIQQEEPEVIVLGLDSMVLDNNDAKGREGCEPTYKKVLGFQPLHLTWGRYLIDADFRPGNVHCNSGDGAYEMIAAMVKDIRAAGMKQPIMVRLDAGFYDFDLLKQLDDLGVGVVMGARITEGNRRLAGHLEADYWRRYDNGQIGRAHV